MLNFIGSIVRQNLCDVVSASPHCRVQWVCRWVSAGNQANYQLGCFGLFIQTLV